VDGDVDPDAERLAREEREWARQRPDETAEARERVAAMAREAMALLGEVTRRQVRPPEVVERMLAGDAALRRRAGVASDELEEALASLRRMGETGDRR
jgi:hypothetical protein